MSQEPTIYRAVDHGCSVSTGIHDGLTFGRGKLSDIGYWEYPCCQCARECEIRDGVELNTYWPFEEASRGKQ